MAQTILITTSSFDLDHPEIAALVRAGFDIRLNPYGRKLTAQEVSALLTPDVVGMIAGVEPLTQPVLQNAKSLRVISRCGAGLDNVDMGAAHARGISVCNTPDAPAAAVAELVIGLMLACLRHLPVQDRAIRAGRWDRPMGGLLSTQAVGLIGYGRIGQRVAQLASAFGAHVQYHDPAHDKSVSLHDLLTQSDIISLHLPYHVDTHHLLDMQNIQIMKKGAILINAARGGLVDEAALEQALQSGHLAAAAVDVFEQEPYCGPLAALENVVLTPHIGSYARETRTMQEREAATNLLNHLVQKEKRHG
jgi:D-3-phosphoglycerate dehydrogenase / 2-oxoglutarate reductase